MLKKQTVWLLTMLSLMIVLSVYYLISPDNGDLAYVNTGDEDSEQTQTDSSTEAEKVSGDATGDAVIDDMTNVGGNELFTTIRMELEDDRSIEKERLEEIVTSGDASAEDKEGALQSIDVLADVSRKESILEESILSSSEYQDVLVRTEEDKVHVHVEAGELLSDTEVVNIMQMVRDEFGKDITVDVNYQPADKE
ncbi:SpoIIIAH-like family protein [Oceanobacillus bengalensis]|uniref:SpoIIIAH-like family protein n=1 Tax=Oceanobacillus bengalensis TaxID=1435466 RepID=A0A494Z0J2_9BACI|nr:SpoIIIAH-like family protein [Oceanobacillus bengalensis]RKQ16047.1 SpoIIIAH-like family protein [Oceanobacillus bengalensis]